MADTEDYGSCDVILNTTDVTIDTALGNSADTESEDESWTPKVARTVVEKGDGPSTKPTSRAVRNSNPSADGKHASNDADAPKLRFYCDVCQKTYGSLVSLRIHKIAIHSTDKPFRCDVCGKGFALKTLLVAHVKSVHKKEKVDDKVRVVCDVCGLNATHGSLRRHRTIHTGERPHQCDRCGKKFRTLTLFRRHCLVHTRETPYKCHICGKRFSQETRLAHHKRNIHTSQTFDCEECGKSFPKERSLIWHKKMSHEPVAVPDCDVCCKTYKSLDALRVHLLLHRGNAPQCHVCLKYYASEVSLKQHQAIHTGIKPHQCEYCSTAFRHRSALVEHIRTHTGEKTLSCDICDKRFTTSSAVTVHRRTQVKSSLVPSPSKEVGSHGIPNGLTQEKNANRSSRIMD